MYYLQTKNKIRGINGNEFYVYLTKIKHDPNNKNIAAIGCVACTSKKPENIVAVYNVVDGKIGIDEDEDKNENS